MADAYHVRISKDYLVFCAGHFITYAGDVCERLHGHNYRVTAEAHGPLGPDHYVIDFVAFRRALKKIVDELDHHMLLPTEHPLIRVVANEREVEATFRDRRWVFPAAIASLHCRWPTRLQSCWPTTVPSDWRPTWQPAASRPAKLQVEVDSALATSPSAN